MVHKWKVSLKESSSSAEF